MTLTLKQKKKVYLRFYTSNSNANQIKFFVFLFGFPVKKTGNSIEIPIKINFFTLSFSNKSHLDALFQINFHDNEIKIVEY